MKSHYQLGDDYPKDQYKHWHRDVLASAGIMVTIWIVIGAFVFSWT